MALLLSNFFSAFGTDNGIPQTTLLTHPWEATPIIIKGIEIFVATGNVTSVQIFNTYNPYSGQHTTPGIVMATFVPTANSKTYRTAWFEAGNTTGFQFPAFSVSSIDRINAVVNTVNDAAQYNVGINILYYRVTDV